MRTSQAKTLGRKIGLGVGVALLLAAVGTGWWAFHGPRGITGARLGPGQYDLHYGFQMDLARGAERKPIHVETALRGQLELADAEPGWMAARVMSPVLTLNDGAKALTDFPRSNGETELGKPWLIRVQPDGRVDEVRFAPGTSIGSRAILMAVATGCAFVHAPQPDKNEWSVNEQDANGTYEARYTADSASAVTKRWSSGDDSKTTATARFRLDGLLVSSVVLEQQGETAADGRDQTKRTTFSTKISLERRGAAQNAWASKVDHNDLQPFNAETMQVPARQEPPSRPLETMLGIVRDLPAKQKTSEHAPLRDELAQAIAKDPAAPARIAQLLREDKSTPQARVMLMEGLLQAETAPAQHEVARLLTVNDWPADRQMQLLAGTALMPNPNQELATSLSDLVQANQNPVYAAKAAMTLGALGPRLKEPKLSQQIVATVVDLGTKAAASKEKTVSQRVSWLEALGNTADPTALPAILTALENDDDPNVRTAAAHALRFQDPAKALDTVQRVMKEDRSMLVRFQLTRSAITMGPKLMLPVVQRALLADKNEYVRLGAAFAVASWMPDSPGLKSVLQAALTIEKDEKVRDSLMNYLNPGRIAPPMVPQPLDSP